MALVNQVQHVLIVGKGNKLPHDALLFVLLLLELEDVLVELLLEGLVGVIDTKLFKRVDGKALEAKDIQHATGRSDIGVILPPNARVAHPRVVPNTSDSPHRGIHPCAFAVHRFCLEKEDHPSHFPR